MEKQSRQDQADKRANPSDPSDQSQQHASMQEPATIDKQEGNMNNGELGGNFNKQDQSGPDRNRNQQE